ncbi:sam dependent carboxyl methyltransferase [Stylonychia lemnae]|uniref:Sam dependent carboxyl methyltransferase n=1 Tax=Stylonychia lemnae TaxID=5949 RepID=A0A078A2H4_STYLE|nr:sam dependent carboxyl methyltransferase [Stylonychia lemnae]|eukprot:CDW76017.1 sam dependent carboxyl methyltransferase [Stylonychia lemnae]
MSYIYTDMKGSARVMHEDYNNTVAGWVNESIVIALPELLECINKLYEQNPERFESTETSFSIADFGCATGASSITPLRTVIDRIKQINSEKEIHVYLEDLPENRFDLAFTTVQEGLKDYKNVFIMAAGKDFSQQVFPNKFLDISFSSLTAMILPSPPAPLDDNVFFLANPENTETERGKKWIEGFNQHWVQFMNSRKAELKKDGLLFVTLIINQNPNKDYQTKENEFYHEVATQVLKKVLTKYNVEDKISSCMKTTVSVYKSHYLDICNSIPDLHVVSSNDFDVKDIFYHEYIETNDLKTFGQKVASYIQGWWGDVLEGGLAQQGVDQQIIKEVSKEVFEILPEFVESRLNIYPEYYNVLALAVQRTA